MPCKRCEELQERIAWLEDELGMREQAAQTRSLTSAFNLTLAEAWYVTVLWSAKGRTLTKHWLEDNQPATGKTHQRRCESDSRVRVHMMRIKKKVGEGVIASDWGSGYYLTKHGMEVIGKILSQPEVERNRNEHSRRKSSPKDG